MELHSILLHILLFLSALSGGILVHRKKEMQGTSPNTQCVQIYFQYLHTTGKDIHHYKYIRKSYIKQTGITVNCV